MTNQEYVESVQKIIDPLELSKANMGVQPNLDMSEGEIKFKLMHLIATQKLTINLIEHLVKQIEAV